MPGRRFERKMLIAIAAVFASVVIIAPLVGVYAFSPLMFVWGVQPYQLAVALSVMLAESLGIAILALAVKRKK